MILKKDEKGIIMSALKASTELDGINFHIYENGIYHITVPAKQSLSMEAVDYSLSFLNAIGQQARYNIIEFASFADVAPSVRIWAADRKKIRLTQSDAIVISNYAQKIMANYYLDFNRPTNKTGIFNSLDSAIDWTQYNIDENK